MLLDTEEWDELSKRLVAIQRELAAAREQMREEQRAHSRIVDDLCLSLIDVSDLVETLANDDPSGYLSKVNRRLQTHLKRHKVAELTVDKVAPNTTKVLETRQVPDLAPGTVLDVCRKGYLRDGKVLRAAEVVAAR